MSWLLPSALGIAAVAGLVAVALHFIARSRPLAEPLPTARFIPQRPVQARTRSIAPSDVALLLLRLAAIAALAFAVAGPVFAGGRGRVARIVVVDRSRAVANIVAVRDSARSLLRAGDALVVFDSSARAASARTLDSLGATNARGSLSAALVAATRAAVSLAARTDSVELVVVSPLATEEFDDATARIRGAWPGAIRVIALQSAPPVQRALGVASTSGSNDAVVAGLALAGALAANGQSAPIRLVRQRVTAADSAWARDSGHVLMHWPMADSTAVWAKRPTIDAIGAVTSDGGTLVGRFPRLWSIDGRAIARWADGEPAAVEHATGAGCIRDVGVLIDPASDLTLRAPFRAFVAPLLAPCGGYRLTARVDSATLAGFRGSNARGALAASASLRDRSSESSRWTPWLLALGALLLIVELAMRRSERSVVRA